MAHHRAGDLLRVWENAFTVRCFQRDRVTATSCEKTRGSLSSSERNTRIMRLSLSLTGFIILVAVLCAGCTSQTPPAVTTPATPALPTAGTTIAPGHPDISLQATPGRYSPFMSSTIGIRLSADYNASVPVVYNWTTDYGYFVSWEAPDHQVTIPGRTVETAAPYIYWSYPPDEMGKEKPPVTIRLVIETERLVHGGSGGRGTIAWKEIRIGWEGNDTAVAGI